MIKCCLDQDGCISLLRVLGVVNQIDQEQAWAICYQLARLMQRLQPSANCEPIQSLAQIFIHKDGFIHHKSCHRTTATVTTTTTTAKPNGQPDEQTSNQKRPSSANLTLSPNTSILLSASQDTSTTSQANNISAREGDSHVESQQKDPNIQLVNLETQLTQPESPSTLPSSPTQLDELLVQKRPVIDERQLVASLGIALFWALDYGIPNDEERKLDRTMEWLIFQSQSQLTLEEIILTCLSRLTNINKSHAESHYGAICKTLVSDTIELSIFLEKIYTASMVLSDISLKECCLDSGNHIQCDIGHHPNKGDLSELGEPLASLRALRINDWARLWMQVIRELRQRGKFKQALLVN